MKKSIKMIFIVFVCFLVIGCGNNHKVDKTLYCKKKNDDELVNNIQLIKASGNKIVSQTLRFETNSGSQELAKENQTTWDENYKKYSDKKKGFEYISEVDDKYFIATIIVNGEISNEYFKEVFGTDIDENGMDYDYIKKNLVEDKYDCIEYDDDKDIKLVLEKENECIIDSIDTSKKAVQKSDAHLSNVETVKSKFNRIISCEETSITSERKDNYYKVYVYGKCSGYTDRYNEDYNVMTFSFHYDVLIDGCSVIYKSSDSKTSWNY